MKTFVKKPVKIQAMTFNEMIEHGLKQEGANIVDGMPWSFEVSGHPISHEKDTLYLISTLEGIMNMTPDDMLIIGIKGEVYPCKTDIFWESYEEVA